MKVRVKKNITKEATKEIPRPVSINQIGALDGQMDSGRSDALCRERYKDERGRHSIPSRK